MLNISLLQMLPAIDFGPILLKAGVDMSKPGARMPREIPREQFCSLSVLGEGAFGTVYKGTIKDPSGTMPEFPVATKILHEDVGGDCRNDLMLEVGCCLEVVFSSYVPGIFLQATIMAQFDHPHVAYLVGVTTKGLPYMLHMAYYEHGIARSWG
jgi:hypothetical protein